jgi:predicted ArsR family transcriptional regulator
MLEFSTAYGTHLTFRIHEHFLKEKGPFSAKELADFLGIPPTNNSLRRIRRSLKELEDMGFLKSDWHRVSNHIFTKKFTTHEPEST